MSPTSRLMVLMSPEGRAALDAKIRTLGVSAGETEAARLGIQLKAILARALIR